MKKFYGCLMCFLYALVIALCIGAVVLIWQLVKTGSDILSGDLPPLFGSSSNSETLPAVSDLNVTFEEIYSAYKSNELVADDQYKGNRYRITSKINGMESGGLFNMTGGATLTMEIEVGNTRVFYIAEFEKDQEEALKQVIVGDTITFEGTCLSYGTWTDCVIVG